MRLPDGWIFVPLESNGITVEVKKQELVFCKHCKYYQDNNDYDGPNYDECRWGHDETPDPEDFCSFGRRMEED